MKLFADSSVGHIVNLKATHPLHYKDKPEKRMNDDISSSFADALKSALNKVNNLQGESDELTNKMIYDPGSVDIHNVMIAAQKAEIALNFTKTVRDDAIRAFRELMNLR